MNKKELKRAFRRVTPRFYRRDELDKMTKKELREDIKLFAIIEIEKLEQILIDVDKNV